MASPYTGQITAFAFPYAPAYWAACDGSTVPMNQYGALYSLIGSTFGGNGTTTIGLPNLGNASPCGTGTGPGLTQRTLGQSFGSATVTLDLTTMPAHNHTAEAAGYSSSITRSGLPTALSALTTSSGGQIYTDGTANAVMSANAASPSGNGTAHNNMQPFIGMNYCIALAGQYPEFD